MSEYILPENVDSPRQNWRLAKVLIAGGVGESALAIGYWNGRPVLASRWNGTADRPNGNPQSRGLSTWYVLPEQYNQAILKSGLLTLGQVAEVEGIMKVTTIDFFKDRPFSGRDGKGYKIIELARVTTLIGRDYLMRVQVFDEPDQEPIVFRVHYLPSFKPDEVLYGSGEVADGRLAIHKLQVSLVGNPEGQFPKNREGQYEISFP